MVTLKGMVPKDKFLVLYERTDLQNNVTIEHEVVTLEELVGLKNSINVVVWFQAKGTDLQYAFRRAENGK